MKLGYLPVLALSCIIWGHAPAYAPIGEPLFESEPPVRVRIIYTLDSIDARVAGADWKASVASTTAALAEGSALQFEVKDGLVSLHSGGEPVLEPAELLILESADTGDQLEITGVPYGIGWWWETREDRRYSGRLEFRVTDEGKLDVVVQLPLEEYLAGVVPQEIGGGTHGQALRAQAVAARTETVSALVDGKYRGPHYDLCADVECQAYGGNAKRTAETDEAVRDTAGLILMVDGKPIGAYYASNHGGHSENIANVWPHREEPPGVYTGQPDSDEALNFDLTKEEDVRRWIESEPAVYENPALTPQLPSWATRNFRWEREIDAEELTAWVAMRDDIGRVVGIEMGPRGISGRLITATFVGESGTFEIGPELAIRQVFEPPLRSSCFIVFPQGPEDRPTSFLIRGAGWGHGVGMSQTGAIARAWAGQDFRAILAHYYPNTTVAPAY